MFLHLWESGSPRLISHIAALKELVGRKKDAKGSCSFWREQRHLGESSVLMKAIHLKSCNQHFGWDAPVYLRVPPLSLFFSSAAGSFPGELRAEISRSFVFD